MSFGTEFTGDRLKMSFGIADMSALTEWSKRCMQPDQGSIPGMNICTSDKVLQGSYQVLGYNVPRRKKNHENSVPGYDIPGYPQGAENLVHY